LATSIEAAIRENRYFPHAKASRTLFAEVVARYRETVSPKIDRQVKPHT